MLLSQGLKTAVLTYDSFSIVPRLALLPVLVLFLVGCVRSALPAQPGANLPIPAQSDWTDYGLIFKAGALGEWDYQLFGGFAATAVKKDGTYYLYYQGASGYRTTGDETVTWRAIGVATSSDGINFIKSSSNPIVTWFPNNNGEEGAVSGGVTLDDNGEIVLYYGANTEQSATLVNADGRLATSVDGLNFTDRGVVLDHKDGSVWGSGDELFPIIAFHDAAQWFVYYIPNGTLQRRQLGVAWGDNRANLTNSSAVRSGLATVPVWGTGGYAKIGPETYALFLNDVTKSRLEVRAASLKAPGKVSAPVETYQFDGVRQATVLLDEETGTWFMYYRSQGGGAYGVKLAPAGEPDTTPPTAPGSVTATPISDRQIDLSWDAATDSETGIVLYRVFRNGVYLATVKGWRFSDAGLEEQTEYSYQVSAVNYHGVAGPRSVPVTATTLVDVTPPRVVSVNASGPAYQVAVVFDEPVDGASAETVPNYAVNQGISVTGASLKPDRKTVTLSTSAHRHGAIYHITINNVRDRAETPNSIAPDAAVNYTHSRAAGLVGAWTFDEGAGETAFDTASYGNDGALIYTDKPGPSWVVGIIGGALQFDGSDDQVTVDGADSLENVTDGSHAFVAWAQSDSVPPNSTANDASYSVLVRERTGLYYDHNGKFNAQIRLAAGSRVAVSSDVFDLGTWHHLAMVVDDTNKRLHLYVDGREVRDSPVSYEGTLADHEDAPYYIGTSEPLTERYESRFKGRIDEVQIYDHALNPAEVEVLFAQLPSRP
jgi:hypothetical protein